MTRDEELLMIDAHIAQHGVYRARIGESSEPHPVLFRNYKQKKRVKKAVSDTGKRRIRNASTISAREKAHAAAGGLLAI